MVGMSGMKGGSLIVVGTGIRVVGQLTVESIASMRGADRLLHVVQDPLLSAMVAQLNPGREESLVGFYGDGKPRAQTYEEMVERVLSFVRAGMATCYAVYGHPGVFAYPTHEAVRRARSEGYPARMLPAVSAEDCLFAELGVDPGACGCQSYEATDFLYRARPLDTSAAVILWQVGAIGDLGFHRDGFDLSALPLLVEKLGRTYPADHVVYLYEAATHPGAEPVITPVRLGSVDKSVVRPMSTMYIPPSRTADPDPQYPWRDGAAPGDGPRHPAARVMSH